MPRATPAMVVIPSKTHQMARIREGFFKPAIFVFDLFLISTFFDHGSGKRGFRRPTPCYLTPKWPTHHSKHHVRRLIFEEWVMTVRFFAKPVNFIHFSTSTIITKAWSVHKTASSTKPNPCSLPITVESDQIKEIC